MLLRIKTLHVGILASLLAMNEVSHPSLNAGQKHYNLNILIVPLIYGVLYVNSLLLTFRPILSHLEGLLSKLKEESMYYRGNKGFMQNFGQRTRKEVMFWQQ